MYAKVFSQMYDGTLCTKGPWQALVTFQQLLVLADMDGNVDMTAGAISRRTTIPLEIIESGIEVLLKEDAESRTPTEDGKRIVPLAEGRSWGWHIVNYKHYRELKREEDRREYHKTYWNEVRAPKLKALNGTQQVQPDSSESTYAEAYAKAKAKKAPAGLPDWVPAEEWEGYMEARRKAKKPTVGRARTLLLNKLQDFHNRGMDVAAILDAATEGGWASLYEPKDGSYTQPASGRIVL